MKQQLGWMGFFILMILVIAFSFIIIGINSQNAAKARGQDPQDDTVLEGASAYNKETAHQTGWLDLMFFRILMYAILFILILFAAAIFIKNIKLKGKGGSMG